MKKVLNFTLALAVVFAIFGCEKKTEEKAVESTKATETKTAKPVEKKEMLPEVKTVCDVNANGIENVIATAKKYNAIAKEKNLEFRRLNVNNSDLILSVEEAIKSGAKEVNPMHFKGKSKSKTKLEINYAASRACHFAITALTQAEDAKKSWRLAVPGDGYKY